MRMSSGASVAYEKPRSGRSICMLETPRSKRIASALDAVRGQLLQHERELAAQEAALDAGLLAHTVEVRRARKGRGRSRSACRGRPGRRRAARRDRRLRTSRRRRSARARRRGSRAPRRRGRERGQSRWVARRSATSSALPSNSLTWSAQAARSQISRWSPHPGDHDLAADARCLRERGRNQHAALLVGLGLRSAGEEVPVHQACPLG